MKFGSGTTSDYTPVFVGGPPRSGTTLLHALLCTSPDMNEYMAECSYLSHLIRGYDVGMRFFDTHTRHYFDDREEMRDYHAALVRLVLDDIHGSHGSPALLALKDPLLTERFATVATLLPQAQFVVSLRDPRDVIASRISVYRRQKDVDEDAPVPFPQIRRWCHQYNRAYHPIIKRTGLFKGRVLVVQYERLVAEETAAQERERMEEFGFNGVDLDAVWGDRVGKANVKTAWKSDLYGQPVTSSSVGRHAALMSEETATRVLRLCQPSLEGLNAELLYR